MKKFLIKFSLFLLPIVLLAYGADVFISSNLRKSNAFVKGEFSDWNALYDKKVSSKILIMGSSRAWVHFDSQMMTDSLKTGVYNLGIDGHNFYMQYFRFQLAMRQPIKPKVIVQSIDIFTLAKREDLFYSEQFLPYMLGNSEMKKVTDNFIGFGPYDYDIPMARYFGKGKAIMEAFKMAFGAKNDVGRIRGYQGQLKPWTNELEEAKAKMGSFTIKLEPAAIVMFENYLKECKANNIQLVFAYTPEFIEGQNFIANRKQMIDLYWDLSKKYDIPFIDYSNDPLSREKKYFYNALHMNKFGAEIFTAKFIQDFKKLKLDY
jgi:hypothetical protein